MRGKDTFVPLHYVWKHIQTNVFWLKSHGLCPRYGFTALTHKGYRYEVTGCSHIIYSHRNRKRYVPSNFLESCLFEAVFIALMSDWVCLSIVGPVTTSLILVTIASFLT